MIYFDQNNMRDVQDWDLMLDAEIKHLPLTKSKLSKGLFIILGCETVKMKVK